MIQTKQQIWEQHLANWNASGKDIHSWCQENNIEEKQFYTWKRRLEKEPSPMFVEVNLPSDGSSSTETGRPTFQEHRLMLYYQGMKLYVPDDFNSNTLLRLLQTMKQL